MLGSLLTRFKAPPAGQWPQAGIVGALKKHFAAVQHIGDDDGFTLYGVSDRGVNFVVALVRPDAEAADRVSEIAFLARFVGFPVDAAAVEGINRNLHLGVASLEGDGDVYLLAGVEAAGAFSEAAFTDILRAWKRDLMVVLSGLSGRSSVAAAFPAARLERARRFAANAAPETASGATPDLLKAYLSAGRTTSVCGDCGGRGRRGLIARTCSGCDGTGFANRGVNR